LRFITITFLAWTAFGVLLGFQAYINASSVRPVLLSDMLRYSLARCWIYALLTPPIFWLTRRHPFTAGTWRRSLAVHLLAFLVYDAAYVVLRLIFWPPVDTTTLQRMNRSVETAWALMRSTPADQLWMYGSVVAVALTIQYYQEFRRRQLREAELKARVAEYELQILKLQLHPHFLFNTLNGISALMTQDVKTAREMMLRLSDLLRIALSHTSAKEISLREELEFIEAYLAIEQMRFGPRLQVRMRIAPETFDARIPNMILQPLVENAVRHGVAARRAGGAIEVASARQNGKLLITISNDGPQARTQPVEGGSSGLGLGNARARLLHLYGTAYNLKINGRPQGGVEVRLEIPFHETTETTSRGQ
jgi:two-component sensor histidine kinase